MKKPSEALDSFLIPSDTVGGTSEPAGETYSTGENNTPLPDEYSTGENNTPLPDE